MSEDSEELVGVEELAWWLAQRMQTDEKLKDFVIQSVV